MAQSQRSVNVLSLAALLFASVSAVRAAEPGAAAAEFDELPGIVFVGGPVVDGEYEGVAGAYHWRDGYVYPKGATFNAWERTSAAPRPGRNLFLLRPARPDGVLTQITSLTTGELFDPEPSYDGRRILFSMRPDGDDWFHLYEWNLDSSELRQLTQGPFNDVSGVYLPDGRIVFCSDRAGILDEYHEERSEMLFRMNADGSGLEQITFTPGSYFEPTVLADGRILCSFWDAFHISVPPFIKHETYLVTLRPDGTDERPLFGPGQHRFLNRTRHSAIGLTRPGELPDGRILVQSELGPALYDPDLGLDYAAALAPIFPGTTSVQTGGTTHKVHLSPLGTRSSPYPLPDGTFLLTNTWPGSRDLGIYRAHPDRRELQRLIDRPDQSEWDPVPVGLPRSIPRRIPDRITPQNAVGETETATFLIVAARDSDTPERRALNARARYLRVLEAEYTAVTTSSHTSLETRVLGTVPIHPDGSAAFEAPADTPLFLETLDAAGGRLVLQAGYMTARAGEVKSCFGCHVPSDREVANGPLAARFSEPLARVTREPCDLEYRRNDPAEYRRQARVGEASVGRAWLASDAPELRRRGAEWLGWLPDEVTSADRKSLAALLNDRDPAVRRQAAMTLSIVGCAEELSALAGALDDDDWQVRHAAATAFEAITGEHPEFALDPDFGVRAWTRWYKGIATPARFLQRLARRELTAEPAALEAVGRTRWIDDAAHRKLVASAQNAWRAKLRDLLRGEPPDPAVVRAAGMLADAEAVALIEPWLIRGMRVQKHDPEPDSEEALQGEVRGTRLAQEAALALGRIGTAEAVAALWRAVAAAVPNTSPGGVRHYQTGPRPEEYTDLRALLLAGAVPQHDHVPFLIALLPYTEGEKPRFEDQARLESQRVLLVRSLLERAGLRAPMVGLAGELLSGKTPSDPALAQAVLVGTNIDRPRSEHGREFPRLDRLSAEQALHLLSTLAASRGEIPEAHVAAALHSSNHRERIEAAVIFRKLGYSPEFEQDLLDELRKPYPFSEIMSIGKGRPDLNFRDKAYMAIALAAHTSDARQLLEFCDAGRWYRDIRIGVAIGLKFRKEHDADEILDWLAGDPLTVVRRLSDEARAAISGDAVAPERRPHSPEPSPAPDLPRAVVLPARPVPAPAPLPPIDGETVLGAVRSLNDAACYANVANTFARHAERMRVRDSRAADLLLDPRALQVEWTEELERELTRALEGPYPFAHMAAARYAAARRALAAVLERKLGDYVAAHDTVGFYWGAEALARIRGREALTVLEPYCQAQARAATFGPVGLDYGYAAARAVGLAAGGEPHPLIDRLKASDNPWLQAGVWNGLIEAGLAQGELPRIREAARNANGRRAGRAVLEQEWRYGLSRRQSAAR